MSEHKAREKGGITVSVMGREMRVSCPEGEEAQLLAAADYLNRKVKEVRDTGKVVGNERIAILAALNVAHESMSNRSGAGASLDMAAVRRKIMQMQETIDSALSADQEKLF